MKSSWQNQPERGSYLLTRLIAWLSLDVSRTLGCWLLYPIALYFVIFAGGPRAASRKYLSTVFARPATLREIYHHYLVYARVLLDRTFFMAGRLEEFTIKAKGIAVIDEFLDSGRGCLCLGAHIGSFDVLRALGITHRQIPIKIMMYPHNSRQFLALSKTLNPELAEAMIVLGRHDTMLLAKEHLDRGGVIGLLGDRIAAGEKSVKSNFFGRPADFPVGPILLASILKIPVVLFSGLHVDEATYEIEFQLFAEEIVISRETRQDDLQKWIDRYAGRLVQICRKAPYNWFNFYDFWESADQTD